MIDNKIRTVQKTKKWFNMGKTEGEMKAFLGILIAMGMAKNEKGVTIRQDCQVHKAEGDSEKNQNKHPIGVKHVKNLFVLKIIMINIYKLLY